MYIYMFHHFWNFCLFQENPAKFSVFLILSSQGSRDNGHEVRGKHLGLSHPLSSAGIG